MTYLVEPKRGIASARNRLVQEAAMAGADYVAFVDDDQLVEPAWPSELVRTAVSTGADAVAGKWLPKFEDDVALWARNTGFWDRPSRPTGTQVHHFGTGNVLIKLEPMLVIPGPFDEQRNLSGGEDTLFFEKFHRNGNVSVWYDTPLVYERIPATRATAKWMLLRGYRAGVGYGGAAFQDGCQSLLSIPERILRASALIVVNTILIVPAIPKGRARIVPRLSKIAMGVGTLLGIAGLGRGYQEYDTIHGN